MSIDDDMDVQSQRTTGKPRPIGPPELRYNGSWCSFLKENYDFLTSLLLKGFCGTTTEPEKFFIELRNERNKCQNLV